MWLVRIVRLGRWKDRNLSEAVKDLTPREGELGLSVYRVADDSESDDSEVTLVAILFALMRDRPDNLDYILIPESLLISLGLEAEPVPTPETHPFLSERHYEIRGLAGDEAEETRLALARGIQTIVDFRGRRIPEKQLIELVRAHAQRDQQFRSHIKSPNWLSILEKY